MVGPFWESHHFATIPYVGRGGKEGRSRNEFRVPLALAGASRRAAGAILSFMASSLPQNGPTILPFNHQAALRPRSISSIIGVIHGGPFRDGYADVEDTKGVEK